MIDYKRGSRWTRAFEKGAAMAVSRLALLVALALTIKNVRVQNNQYIRSVRVKFPDKRFTQASTFQDISYEVILDERWYRDNFSSLSVVRHKGRYRTLTVHIQRDRFTYAGFDNKLIDSYPLNTFYSKAGYMYRGRDDYFNTVYNGAEIVIEIQEDINGITNISDEPTLAVRIKQNGYGVRKEIILIHALVYDKTANAEAVPIDTP